MTYKFVNTEQLPRKRFGNKLVIDWTNIKSQIVSFRYHDVYGDFIISYKDRVKGGCILDLIYEGKHYDITNGNFMKCKFGVIIGEYFNAHKYNVGEVINGLKILEQTNIIDARNSSILAYRVKCEETGKEFVQTQFNMSYGYGSKYKAGTIVWEGNWLYNETHLHRFIKNIEDAKLVSKSSDAKILCICPHCKSEKYVIVNNLYKYGMSCDNCRPSMSYPERFFIAYLKVKNIDYVYQFRLGKLRRFIDFYLPDHNIAVEVHGGQHYNQSVNSVWKNSFKSTLASDELKRKYCKENNIELIELDCRKSYYAYIKESIKYSKLPNITSIEESTLKKEMAKTRFSSDKLKILNDYKLGKSSNSISKKYGVSIKTVTNIARRHGIYEDRSPHKKIQCLNTGEIFNSIAEASRSMNINVMSISNCINGKQKAVKGRDGMLLYWRRIV